MTINRMCRDRRLINWEISWRSRVKRLRHSSIWIRSKRSNLNLTSNNYAMRLIGSEDRYLAMSNYINKRIITFKPIWTICTIMTQPIWSWHMRINCKHYIKKYLNWRKLLIKRIKIYLNWLLRNNNKKIIMMVKFRDYLIHKKIWRERQSY